MKPTLLIVLMVAAFTSCDLNKVDASHLNELEAAIEAQQLTIDSLNHQIDSLQQVNNELKEDEHYWFDTWSGAYQFEQLGIYDGKERILSQLYDSPQLIPMEAVLGGTMMFGRIELLGDSWLIAEYDDGHVVGKSLYEYKVDKEGKITFSILRSDGPL